MLYLRINQQIQPVAFINSNNFRCNIICLLYLREGKAEKIKRKIKRQVKQICLYNALFMISVPEEGI